MREFERPRLAIGIFGDVFDDSERYERPLRRIHPDVQRKRLNGLKLGQTFCDKPLLAFRADADNPEELVNGAHTQSSRVGNRMDRRRQDDQLFAFGEARRYVYERQPDGTLLLTPYEATAEQRAVERVEGRLQGMRVNPAWETAPYDCLLSSQDLHAAIYPPNWHNEHIQCYYRHQAQRAFGRHMAFTERLISERRPRTDWEIAQDSLYANWQREQRMTRGLVIRTVDDPPVCAD